MHVRDTAAARASRAGRQLSENKQRRPWSARSCQCWMHRLFGLPILYIIPLGILQKLCFSSCLCERHCTRCLPLLDANVVDCMSWSMGSDRHRWPNASAFCMPAYCLGLWHPTCTNPCQRILIDTRKWDPTLHPTSRKDISRVFYAHMAANITFCHLATCLEK